MLIPNDQFVSELRKLFEQSTTKHSVYITSKTAPPPLSTTTNNNNNNNNNNNSILFRLTNGTSTNKIKFSTLVPPCHLASFQSSYLPLLRTQLCSALKKRDKTKERKMEKLREQTRKKLIQTVERTHKIVTNHIGNKRGAGRRMRQRALKKAKVLRSDKANQTRRKATRN